MTTRGPIRRARLVAALLVVAGGGVVGRSMAASAATPASAPHVMVVMMENQNYSGVIGQTGTQPYTNSLATDYGLATQSYSIITGSLPNYLAMVSGSTQGTDDVLPPQKNFPNTPTIADQLVTAGYTVKAYAEDLPADPGTITGDYTAYHFPWPYFPNAAISYADSSALIPDLNSPGAPDFVWYSPNVIDDEDSGTVQDGDAFLSSFIPQVQSTSWYKAGGQIVIEWDESADDTSGINGGTGGGHIPTIVVSAALAAHPAQDATPVDQIGILYSIENLYGVPLLGFAGDGANGNIDALLSASGEPPTTTTPPTTAAPPTTAPPAPTTTAPTPTATTGVTTTTAPPSATTTGATTTTAPPSSTTKPTTTTSTPATKAGGQGSSSSGGSAPAGAVSAPSSALAFTGTGAAMRWLTLAGALLVLVGLMLFAAAESARRLGMATAVASRVGRVSLSGRKD
jgi:acid phosphatase